MDTKQRSREMYRQMIRIRVFEETLRRLYFQDKLPNFNIAAGDIPGELHLCDGQEPVGVGICMHLRPTDAIAPPHRHHHYFLARGVDMKKMAAEIFGKETGLNHGCGGHIHLCDRTANMSTAGVCGGGIPTGLGYALAFKARKTDDIVMVISGDGTISTGAWHECVNLAALWKLPVVFICEDNDWAISTPKKISTPVPHHTVRAAAYGIPGGLILENDPLAIYEGIAPAVARARRGEGPSFIEIKTDRLAGHFEGDPQLYRPKHELETLRSRDAIVKFKQRLLQDGTISEAQAEAIGKAAEAEVNEAMEFARTSPYPQPESALQHVFA
jgi:TPP-dependent pyruvate/acetoin dehydrogenase alpha subunit